MNHVALVRYVLEAQSQPAWEERVRAGHWLHKARAAGVNADSLRLYQAQRRAWTWGPAALVWNRVCEHYESQKVVPTVWDVDRMVQDAYAMGALTSDDTTALRTFLGEVTQVAPRPESFTWALEETQKEIRRQQLVEVFVGGSDALALDPEKAEEILRAAVRPTRPARLMTFSELAATRWDVYQRIKAGEWGGTRTGLVQFDQTYMGLEATDLLVISARLNSGKSWLSTLLAFNCYLAGGLVVFVTGEHTASDYSNRIEGLYLGVDPMDIRTATLAPEAEEVYRQVVAGWAISDLTKGQIVFADRGAITTPQGVSDLVDLTQQDYQRKVDLCVVDPLYALARSMAPDDLGVVAKDLKQACMDLAVPIATTHQDNRESAKDAKAGSESLYGSDIIGHEADWHWRVTEGPDGQTWIVRLAKVRKGPKGREIILMVDLTKGLLKEPAVPQAPPTNCFAGSPPRP